VEDGRTDVTVQRELWNEFASWPALRLDLVEGRVMAAQVLADETLRQGGVRRGAELTGKVFIRVHRSAIVNIERIKELHPASHGEYVIVLRSGVRLQSTRNYHEKLKALTSNPF
jgi:hypothetical protein